MSAFIVSDATMDRVVSAILKNFERGAFAGVLCRMDDAGDKIGRQLYAMNAEAVAQRYNESSESYEAKTYRWLPRGYPRGGSNQPGEWYKAVGCLIYQCSEGNVPECELFKELSAFHDELAHLIASHGAAYNDAPWDSARSDQRYNAA